MHFIFPYYILIIIPLIVRMRIIISKIMVRGQIRHGTRYSATIILFYYCAAFISPRVLQFSAFHCSSSAFDLLLGYATNNSYSTPINRCIPPKGTLTVLWPVAKHDDVKARKCVFVCTYTIASVVQVAVYSWAHA